jgi:hypothetical protein
MNVAISEIPYVPPAEAPEFYAACSLERLRAFEQLDSRLLAYMLAPSNVLALAGLRSFSPYNSALNFDVDMPKFEKLLVSYELIWINESPNVADPRMTSYALVNFNVADQLSRTYPLGAVTTTGKILERSLWGFYGWQSGLDIALARTIESNVLPKRWLKDWWSPHDIRFGMLLGYPGVAISTFVESESAKDNWKDLEEVVISLGRFNSADVRFMIHTSLRQREDITSMIATWQNTLAAVYEIYPEEQLMKDAGFATAVEAMT